MDRIELKTVLSELGWSQSKLARRIGVNVNTISRWSEVPGPVAAYIELYCRVRALLDEPNYPTASSRGFSVQTHTDSAGNHV